MNAGRAPRRRPTLRRMSPLTLRLILGLVAAGFCALPGVANADFTVTLPKGTFALDTSYFESDVTQQYGDNRQVMSLLKGIERYEPGGGWQGTINADPKVLYRFVLTQLMYGISNNLTAVVALPLVLDATIDTNLSWQPGEYMSSLGRPYGEADFWAWAKSMGQPKPTARWRGNENTLGDMIVALRYRLPQLDWMARNDVQWAARLQIALPTGRAQDSERLVTAGTTAWDLHAYGDAELHLAIEKFWRDAHGVTWLSVGADAYYAWLRPRTFDTPTGALNPLLMNWRPYVGDTYVIDGGDWVCAQAQIAVSPLAGPTFATYITKGSMELAHKLPRLLMFSATYLYVATMQTDFQSDSPLWEYDGREEAWRPGDKQTLVFTATLSLLRLGAPLQIYARARRQTILHGRNTRAANVNFIGVRLLAKFW